MQVLQLGMNFRTAEDMSAILAVKLRKRLGFGMSAKLHLMGMHVEGKVNGLRSLLCIRYGSSHKPLFILLMGNALLSCL